MKTFIEKVKSLQERKPTWFAGGTPVQREKIAAQLTQEAINQGKKVWAINQEDRNFYSYGLFVKLIQHVYPIVMKENPQLFERFAHTLQYVAPEFLELDTEVKASVNADAVTFAIIRRISRESLQTPEHIDSAARFFLEAKRTCPSLSGSLEILIQSFEWVDRPSLRILFRIQVLSTKEDNLHWSVFLSRWPLVKEAYFENNMESRLSQARQLIFHRIFQDLEPDLSQLGEGTEPDVNFSDSFNQSNQDEFEQNWIHMTSHLLVQMNYDRAYVVAAKALRSTSDAKTIGEINRLIGLIDANIGDFRAARFALSAALDLAESPTLKAHLHYLIGLLYTKRFRDLDSAEHQFHLGLEHLSSLPESDPTVMLERAWLMNGQGFARTLKAKELPEAERTKALEANVLHEISAYNLARKHDDSHFVYLRFNLLANIAFLLEILGRYGQASDFWHRAFQQYLNEDQVNEFQMVYHYRQAMLLFRDGKQELAFQHIADSLKLAQHFGDRFLEERIHLGYGYIAYQMGQFERAFTMHENGLKQAWELRNWDAMVEHSIALAWTALQLGRSEVLTDLAQLVVMIPGKREVGEAFKRAVESKNLLSEGLRLSIPSPKLPAYLPSIDLEMTPTWDINKYLVSDEKDQQTVAVKSSSR